MITIQQMRRYRSKMQREFEVKGEQLPQEWMDDAMVVQKWMHNTNIEASDELLKRLRKYHGE